MSNKAQWVGSRARGEAECCKVPRDPTLSALLLIQHILSMLQLTYCDFICLCCVTKAAVLYDSYSTASSFDPPTQNTISWSPCWSITAIWLGAGSRTWGGGDGGGDRREMEDNEDEGLGGEVA